tara:strand:+ start:3308 stop:3487 length:180 start_codon:yes stop_codon:yes gene_type:complete
MIDLSESTSYGQDRFVNNILNKKKVFLEIGFVEAEKYNNKYILEKKIKLERYKYPWCKT